MSNIKNPFANSSSLVDSAANDIETITKQVTSVFDRNPTVIPRMQIPRQTQNIKVSEPSINITSDIRGSFSSISGSSNIFENKPPDLEEQTKKLLEERVGHPIVTSDDYQEALDSVSLEVRDTINQANQLEQELKNLSNESIEGMGSLSTSDLLGDTLANRSTELLAQNSTIDGFSESLSAISEIGDPVLEIASQTGEVIDGVSDVKGMTYSTYNTINQRLARLCSQFSPTGYAYGANKDLFDALLYTLLGNGMYGMLDSMSACSDLFDSRSELIMLGALDSLADKGDIHTVSKSVSILSSGQQFSKIKDPKNLALKTLYNYPEDQELPETEFEDLSTCLKLTPEEILHSDPNPIYSDDLDILDANTTVVLDKKLNHDNSFTKTHNRGSIASLLVDKYL